MVFYITTLHNKTYHCPFNKYIIDKDKRTNKFI